jgi:membrane protease YdiL (CAAX protease family)
LSNAARSHNATSPPNAGHWPDERPRLPSRLTGLAVAALLGIVGVTALFCIGGLAALAVALIKNPSLFARFDIDALISPEFLFASFFAGFGTFALCGAAIAVAVGWRVRHALALRTPSVAAMGIAIVGGLTVGLFPGWIAQQIIEAAPDLANRGALEMITNLLTTGPLYGRALVIITITVGAPIFEELCFRGLLWNALERVVPGLGGQLLALVVTSLAFAIVHADPVQSTALLPTAFFLGWLRMTSGSIWPCIAAHFVNNALAAGLTIALSGAEETAAGSLGLAIGGLVLTLILVTASGLLRRRPLATPEAAWATAQRGP